MKLISDIIARPGWNTAMLMLLAKATFILIAALGITVAMQRASAGARHLVWLITLGALLLVPALATFTPLRMEILPARAETAAKSIAPSPVVTVDSRSLPSATSANGASSTASAPQTSVSENSGFLANMSGFSLLVAVWAA